MVAERVGAKRWNPNRGLEVLWSSCPEVFDGLPGDAMVDNHDNDRWTLSAHEDPDRRDEMADLSYAVADLARSFGVALTAFAEAVRPEQSPAAEPSTPDLTALGLGRRQREIAELPGLNSDRGMRASEVAAEIEYDA